MKAIAVFLLFLGTILVLQGYYDQRFETSCPPARKEVKLVPMSVYEEQLKPSESLSKQFKSMFEDVMTWPTVRNVSALQESAEKKDSPI